MAIPEIWGSAPGAMGNISKVSHGACTVSHDSIFYVESLIYGIHNNVNLLFGYCVHFVVFVLYGPFFF